MSTPPVPPAARPGMAQVADAASVRHVRTLFQRKMLDRAVAVANARWPGSGEMVKLAAEWSALSPTDRRTRLSDIGPEDLARMRTLADLNPDLARVLDDLEERGVLPPTMYSAEPGAPTQEALVDAALNLGEEVARQAADRADNPATIAAAAAAGAALARTFPQLVLLPQVDMPSLELGLPSTDEFLDAETQRRIEATTSAREVLERVRQRIDRNAAHLVQSADERPVEPLVPPIEAVHASRIAAVPSVDHAAEESLTGAAPTPLVDELVDRLRTEQIVVIDASEPTPNAAVITSIARALNVSSAEFTLRAGESRPAFGSLRRRGLETRVEAGPLPRAMAARNLVVVRGSVYPTMVSRWRAGFCDIPGTKASTSISPDCRILVIPGTDRD